jgi:tRNA-dihydrouridine synthase B
VLFRSEKGADAVDLNCGCPVRKVRAAGAGSKLMEDPALIGRLVAAMRKISEVPVSIKIRVGPNATRYNAVEVARIAEAEGADFLTVHGRHAGEAYGTPCRYEEIAKVVSALKIPVIGNGDVKDAQSAKRMFEETGCAGLMIGRACMGAPWVFSKISEELLAFPFQAPPLHEIGALLLEHHDLLAELLGADNAIRQCRKLGSFYSKHMPGAREFRNRLNFCLKREDLADLVRDFFKT